MNTKNPDAARKDDTPKDDGTRDEPAGGYRHIAPTQQGWEAVPPTEKDSPAPTTPVDRT